jgi:hypothetical protein
MSTQTPPQSVFPCGHWQVPLQTLPPVHAVPQVPQLAGSVAVSTQLPLHSVVPVGHWQLPLHCFPFVQMVPHAPQLLRSVAMSTQTLPQSVAPSPQTTASVLASVVAPSRLVSLGPPSREVSSEASVPVS